MSFKSVLFASVASLVLVGAAAAPAVAQDENRTLSFEPSGGTPSPPDGSVLVERGTWQIDNKLPGEYEGVITGAYEGVATYLYAYVGTEYNGQYLGVSLWNKERKILDCAPVQVYNGAVNAYSLSGDGHKYVSQFGICYPGFTSAPLSYAVYNKAE